MKKKIGFLFLVLLSGAVLIFAFPPFSLWFYGWLCFVPILLFLDDKNFLNRFFYGFIAGFVFYVITLHWVFFVAGFFYLFLAFYLAIFWGLFFGLIFSFSLKTRIIIGASLWYFFEILIQYLMTGFPWIFLSLSQWSFPFTSRIASVTGSSGLSALMIAVNLSFYSMIKHRKFLPLLVSFFVLFFLILLPNVLPIDFNQKTVKIAAVQGNAGYFGQNPEDSFGKYKELTDSIEKKFDLVIWPESSYPEVFKKESHIYQYLIEKSYYFPVLIGTMTEENKKIFNTALFLKNGRINKYDKKHLVPFGEYVPGKNLRFIKEIYLKKFGSIPEITPGKKVAPFYLNSDKFCVLICFENIFPHIAQNYLKYSPDFFIVITNDSWYKNSFAPYQHFAHNIFRAIETGKYFVQVSTTGLTGFTTSEGEYKIFKKNGNTLFVEGVMEINVPVNKKIKSFYGIIGEIGIFWLFILLTGVCFCRT